MADLQKLQRTAIRKAVTISINSAKGFLAEEDVNKHISSLQGLASLLRKKLNTLDDLDTTILGECEENEVDREITESNTYQTNVYICLAEIERALESVGLPQQTEQSFSRTTSMNSLSQQ